MKTLIQQPKFAINSKVYACLKDGVTLLTIKRIEVIIREDETEINYYFSPYSFDAFAESQIIKEYADAQNFLKQNGSQLQLAIL